MAMRQTDKKIHSVGIVKHYFLMQQFKNEPDSVFLTMQWIEKQLEGTGIVKFFSGLKIEYWSLFKFQQSG